VTLRQAVEIQFDKAEHANKFSKAVSFVNHHKFLHGEYDFSDEKPLDSIALRIYMALPFPAKECKREKVPADLTGRSAPDVYDTFGTFLGIYPLLTSVIVCLYNLDGFFRKSIRIPVCAGQGAVPFLQAPDHQPIVHADDDDLIVDACQLS
jgi:hypothetical protein